MSDPHLVSRDVAFTSARELRRQFDVGEISSRDLVGTLRTRIEVLDRAGEICLRSVAALDEGAEEVAAARDRQRAAGEPVGPLHGLPVLIKDNRALHLTGVVQVSGPSKVGPMTVDPGSVGALLSVAV